MHEGVGLVRSVLVNSSFQFHLSPINSEIKCHIFTENTGKKMSYFFQRKLLRSYFRPNKS